MDGQAAVIKRPTATRGGRDVTRGVVNLGLFPEKQYDRYDSWFFASSASIDARAR